MQNEEPKKKIQSFEDLFVWQKARQLVKAIYEATQAFPREELYGLTQQMRRAVISILSNIAEGYGRGTRKDYVHFLFTASGSLYELQSQLIVAHDLGYLDAKALPLCRAFAEECSRILYRLIESLKVKNED